MNAFDLDTIALGAASVATVLAAIGAVPQVRRVARTGDVRGVSFSMVTLNAASEVGWFTHFAGRGQWAAVPASFVIVATYSVLALTLARAGSPARQSVAIGAGWVVVLIGSRLSIGPGALATLLAVTKVVQVTPQIWTAWRTKRPTGVSSTMWVIAVVEALLWAGYGTMRGDVALVFLGSVGATAGVAVLVRLATIPRSGCPVVPLPELSTTESAGRAQDTQIELVNVAA